MAVKKYPIDSWELPEDKKYAISPKEVEAEYQELAAKMGMQRSKYMPRIIKRLITLRQARVFLETYTPPVELAKEQLNIDEETIKKNIRKYQIEAIAKKLNLDKETVEKDIQNGFEKGCMFPTRRLGWRFANNYIQLRDSQTNTKFDEELGDEYWDLWQAFDRVETFPTTGRAMFLRRGALGRSQRIVPARKAIENIPDRIPTDDIEETLKLARVIAVTHCPCRRIVRDRRCKQPDEVCILLDRLAEFALSRGPGVAREITVDEALHIFDKCQELGAVCNVQENQVLPRFICNCHADCCDILSMLIQNNIPFKSWLETSRYQALVDPEKCIGCQKCMERCMFGAAEMKTYPITTSWSGYPTMKAKGWVNPDKCMGCGLCVLTCPSGARTMKLVKSELVPPEEQPVSFSYTQAPQELP